MNTLTYGFPSSSNPYDDNHELKWTAEFPKETTEKCYVLKCNEKAKRKYVVGKYHQKGMEICLCEIHDDEDTAWDIYSEVREPE